MDSEVTDNITFRIWLYSHETNSSDPNLYIQHQNLSINIETIFSRRKFDSLILSLLCILFYYYYIINNLKKTKKFPIIVFFNFFSVIAIYSNDVILLICIYVYLTIYFFSRVFFFYQNVTNNITIIFLKTDQFTQISSIYCLNFWFIDFMLRQRAHTRARKKRENYRVVYPRHRGAAYTFGSNVIKRSYNTVNVLVSERYPAVVVLCAGHYRFSAISVFRIR